MSNRRIGGVSYFTPQERKLLKFYDQQIEDESFSLKKEKPPRSRGASKLKKAREKRGWSQKDLADRLGTTAHLVSKWENDRVQFSWGRVATVCMNCRHFYLHYLKSGKWYRPAEYGHCVKLRLKIKKTYDTCEHFELNEEAKP